MIPTIAVTVDDIKGEIGHYLGYGRGEALGETAWTTAQTNDINVLLKSALNRIYEPIFPTGETYEWSFLSPYTNIVLTSGVSTVGLPSDFGGFVGPLLLTGTAATRWYPIEISNESHVEYLHQVHANATGAPRVACEQILKEVSHHDSNRSNLRVWPTPDSAYTLRADYKYAPNVLTGGYRYPPGGPLIGELFMAAAAAVAELKLDDMKGPREAYFMERLVAAMKADRKRKANKLGYNGNPGHGGPGGYRSALWMRDYSRRYGWGNTVTVNGTEYD